MLISGGQNQTVVDTSVNKEHTYHQDHQIEEKHRHDAEASLSITNFAPTLPPPGPLRSKKKKETSWIKLSAKLKEICSLLY